MSILKTAFSLLFLSIFFFSCSKESTVSGTFIITKVHLEKYPVNKSDGSTWDIATTADDVHPDVHLNYAWGTDPIIKTTVISNFSPRIKNDAYPNHMIPYSNFSTLPTSINQDITFGVWDTENGSLASSEMMSSITVNFKDLLGDYIITKPTTVIVSNDDVKIKCFVTWELDS